MLTSRLPVVVALAATIASMSAAPVQAKAEPVGPAAFIWASGGAGCTNRSMSDCDMLHLEVDLVKADTPAGTTVLLQLRGCEGDEDVKMMFADTGLFPDVGTPFAIGDTTPTSDDGSLYEVPYSLWTAYPGEDFHLGPDWTGTLTVTKPGVAPWVQEISRASPSSNATLGQFTDGLVCPRDNPDPSVLVDTWSKVTGKRIVGRRVSVTPTTFTPAGVAIGAKASYAWLVGKRVVSRRSSVRLKRSYAGKTLSIRITVSAPGKKDAVRGGSLGRVRARR